MKYLILKIVEKNPAGKGYRGPQGDGREGGQGKPSEEVTFE